jgi:hypothetical protein
MKLNRMLVFIVLLLLFVLTGCLGENATNYPNEAIGVDDISEFVFGDEEKPTFRDFMLDPQERADIAAQRGKTPANTGASAPVAAGSQDIVSAGTPRVISVFHVCPRWRNYRIEILAAPSPDQNPYIQFYGNAVYNGEILPIMQLLAGDNILPLYEGEVGAADGYLATSPAGNFNISKEIPSCLGGLTFTPVIKVAFLGAGVENAVCDFFGEPVTIPANICVK